MKKRVLTVSAAIGVIIVLLLLAYHYPLMQSDPVNTPPQPPPSRTHDKEEGEGPNPFLSGLGSVTHLALSAKGDYIVACTETRRRGKGEVCTMQVWARPTRQHVAKVLIDDEISALAISPSGHTIALSYWFGGIQLWDRPTWKLQATLGVLEKKEWTAA